MLFAIFCWGAIIYIVDLLTTNNGVILKKELAKLNKSEQWLQQLLKEKGYKNDKILYMPNGV